MVGCCLLALLGVAHGSAELADTCTLAINCGCELLFQLHTHTHTVALWMWPWLRLFLGSCAEVSPLLCIFVASWQMQRAPARAHLRRLKGNAALSAPLARAVRRGCSARGKTLNPKPTQYLGCAAFAPAFSPPVCLLTKEISVYCLKTLLVQDSERGGRRLRETPAGQRQVGGVCIVLSFALFRSPSLCLCLPGYLSLRYVATRTASCRMSSRALLLHRPRHPPRPRHLRRQPPCHRHHLCHPPPRLHLRRRAPSR